MSISATEVDPVAEEEFLSALYKGGELLAAGKVGDARGYLEKAHSMEPNNEKAQNLLGLTYFKLGLFEQAAAVYERLVNDNPVDPTLRVNLGLVYLKANALDRCIHELATATDLDPSHAKAHNYLGLALAQRGDYARAKDHFQAAGSEQMTEKMTRALMAQREASPRPDPTPEAPAAQLAAPGDARYMVPHEAPLPDVPFGEGRHQGLEGDWGAQFHEPAAGSIEEDINLGADEEAPRGPHEAGQLPPLESRETPVPGTPAWLTMEAAEAGASGSGGETAWVTEGLSDVPLHADAPSEEDWVQPRATTDWGTFGEADTTPQVGLASVDAAAAPTEPVASSPVGFSAIKSQRLVDFGATSVWVREPSFGPFHLGADGLAITVSGGMLTRMDGLVAIVGSLEVRPEVRRKQGRPTLEPFGEGLSQLQRVTGQGLVYFERNRFRCFSVDLASTEGTSVDDDGAYFRESSVFAFEEPVFFENGELSGEGFGVSLVHLKGTGKVLLQLEGTLKAMPIPVAAPMVVPLRRLVGWFGRATPRLLPFGGMSSIELTGDGYVLLETPGERT